MRIGLIGAGFVSRYHLTATVDSLSTLRLVEDCRRLAAGEPRS